jgi:carbon storage regulator
MLVLTRKLNQSLIIGDNIELVILDVQNGNVKIGIKAPKHIRIMRKEVIEQVTEINKNSTLNANKIDLNELVKKISK